MKEGLPPANAGMRRPLVALPLLLASCAGAPAPTERGAHASPAPTVEPAKAAATATDASAPAAGEGVPDGAARTAYRAPRLDPPSPAPAPLDPARRNPAIMALANAVLQCKPADVDDEKRCPAVRAWRQPGPAFEASDANTTMLSLLEDPDVRVRRLVSSRELGQCPSFVEEHRFFEDRENARRLVAIEARETDDALAAFELSPIELMDTEKVGLESEVFALTDHPDKRVRAMLAASSTSYRFNWLLAERLLNDDDPQVRADAISYLDPRYKDADAQEAACKALGQLMTDGSAVGAAARDKVAKGGCDALYEPLVATLEARVRARIGKAPAVEDDRADTRAARDFVGSFEQASMNGGVGPEIQGLERRLFKLGVTLAASPDAHIRSLALEMMAHADGASAGPVIEKLLRTEQDPAVLRAGKSLLAYLRRSSH